MNDEPRALDRAEPPRRLAAWERDPGCAVCEIPVREAELDDALVIPFPDGDRVAHRDCYTWRKERGSTLPPIGGDFGMRG